jgi:hypothetical protein
MTGAVRLQLQSKRPRGRPKGDLDKVKRVAVSYRVTPEFKAKLDAAAKGWKRGGLMRCERIMLPDGSRGFVCFDRRRMPRCSVRDCGAISGYQCDAPVAGRRSGTCDKHVCAKHRVPRGAGVDYCPEHAEHVPRQGTLFG